MRIVRACISALCIASFTGDASAQTPTVMLAFPPEWGTVDVRYFIEVDGRPETLEVLVWSLDTFKWRVVYVQPSSGWCIGEWFYWGGDPWIYPSVRRNANNRDIVFATKALGDGSSLYLEFSVELPSCTIAGDQ